MVIGQGIDSHIWEEEFDLLHCSLLHQKSWKATTGAQGMVQGYLLAMFEMDSVW